VHYRLLMLGTFFLTVVFDLTVAVQVGLVAACALFIHRMSALFQVEPAGRDGDTLRFRLYGSLFFGAVARIDTVVQAVEDGPPAPQVVLDALQLVHLDTSGLDALRQLHKLILLRGGTLQLENLQDDPRGVLERAGFLAELQARQPSPEASL
jgi:SulP family sulfate permease